MDSNPTAETSRKKSRGRPKGSLGKKTPSVGDDEETAAQKRPSNLKGSLVGKRPKRTIKWQTAADLLAQRSASFSSFHRSFALGWGLMTLDARLPGEESGIAGSSRGSTLSVAEDASLFDVSDLQPLDAPGAADVAIQWAADKVSP